MLEEAIAAEELNKIHAMEAVITSNVSLVDSFQAHRAAAPIVWWTGATSASIAITKAPSALAYRGAIGRRDRGEPSSDIAALRAGVVATGEPVIIDDVTRDRRVADAGHGGQEPRHGAAASSAIR